MRKLSGWLTKSVSRAVKRFWTYLTKLSLYQSDILIPTHRPPKGGALVNIKPDDRCLPGLGYCAGLHAGDGNVDSNRPFWDEPFSAGKFRLFFHAFFRARHQPLTATFCANNAGFFIANFCAALCRLVFLPVPLLPNAVATGLFGAGHAFLPTGRRYRKNHLRYIQKPAPIAVQSAGETSLFSADNCSIPLTNADISA